MFVAAAARTAPQAVSEHRLREALRPRGGSLGRRYVEKVRVREGIEPGPAAELGLRRARQRREQQLRERQPCSQTGAEQKARTGCLGPGVEGDC